MAFIKWFFGLFKSAPKKSTLEKSVEKIESCETGGVCPVDVSPPSAIQKGTLWYPYAIRYVKNMKSRGKFKGGYPVGIIVHFTAGHSGGIQKAYDSIVDGINSGYNYLCIADNGEIVQASPLSDWGYHAGESKWSKSNLFSGTVSDETVGIEMNNAGKVEKVGDNRFKTWFNTYLTSDQVRYVTEKDYGCPTGYYHKYTEAQERTLIEFCVWAIKNDPTGRLTYETVLGHHEVAGVLGLGYFRKNDPGGALSMSMPQFRQIIKDLTK